MNTFLFTDWYTYKKSLISNFINHKWSNFAHLPHQSLFYFQKIIRIYQDFLLEKSTLQDFKEELNRQILHDLQLLHTHEHINKKSATTLLNKHDVALLIQNTSFYLSENTQICKFALKLYFT